MDDPLDDSDSDLDVRAGSWDDDVPEEVKNLYVDMIKHQQEMGVAKFNQLCTYVFKPGTIWAFEYWKLLTKAIRLAKVHGRELGISRYLAGAEAKLEQMGLKQFESNYAANLSGGNKRKLMVVITDNKGFNIRYV